MAINENHSADPAGMGDAFRRAREEGDKKTRGPRSFFDARSGLFESLKPSHPELEKFQNLLAKALEKASTDFVFTLIPITHEHLLVPALAVLAMKSDKPEAGMGYQLVMIETEESILQTRTDSINYQGLRIETERSLGEVYDRTYQTIVREVLANKLPNTTFFDAAPCVLFRGLNLEDPLIFNRVAYNIAMAATTALVDQTDGPNEICLGDIEDRGVYSLRTDYLSTQVAHAVDSFGQPVRRDVTLTLAAAARQLPGQPTNREEEVGEVSGFVDLIAMPEKKYIPRFVITQIQPGRNAPDLLSMQLLMIGMASTLTENNSWYDALVNPNMDLTRTSRLEALLPDFPRVIAEPDEMAQKLRDIIRPNLVFSMDIANAGADTWRTEVWAAAAHGSEAARSHILHTAQHLCAGRFNNYFNGHDQVVFTENNPIPLGYYADRDGSHRDVRDVDQLLVTALTYGRDPRLSEDWAATYMNLSIPEPVRLAKRKDMIRGLLGKVQFTDIATRVSFGASFINALRNGLRDAGFAVRVPQKPQAWTPDYPFASQAAMGAQESGLFRQPFQGQSYGPGPRSGFDRWN
jgi:hypothetical protein